MPIAADSWIWRSQNMDKDQVLATLRAHEGELRAAGIMRLSLFGSVARNQANAESDVDLMAEFDGRKFSLLYMVALENCLSDLLGVKVDLTPAKSMKAPVRDHATREAVLAFS